jgi:hypothetical protein
MCSGQPAAYLSRLMARLKQRGLVTTAIICLVASWNDSAFASRQLTDRTPRAITSG